uniref:CSON007453 protein n=1 Tax=Culicoides sonorensis TaxID=179676 RepID=A0A336LDE5_CULSO
MKFLGIVITLSALCVSFVAPQCTIQPATTVSGTHAPANFCPGDLIFDENFERFNAEVWDHEISMFGGYNGEFQWYTNDPSNLYVKDDRLFITPTLTYKYLPCRCEADLSSYKLNISAEYPYICHISDEEGCYMEGKPDQILNPIRSSKVKSHESFRLKYGKIEVKAKTPRGEFLWPAVWMLPYDNVYGGWPNSGEIDILESRGNDVILVNGETNIGNQEVGCTLHFGKYHQYDGVTYHQKPGFHKDFHLYKVEWTPNYLRFQVDNYDPWYNYGPFQGNYTGSNSVLAPFDQEFYFLLNLAVGGTNGYFPEEGVWYPNGKPYTNSEGRRASQTKFWQSNMWQFYEDNPEEASFQIDYIKPQCSTPPVTTISGTHAPSNFCPGDLVFDENFNQFDNTLWEHEVSLFGGYNGEFQWYTNDPDNLYVKDNRLYITPTMTYKYLPCKCEADLYSYKLNLTAEYPYRCDNPDEEGCYMEGRPGEILNPFRSSKVWTPKSFRMKYGKIEVRAKTPRGEFLWPAVWMLPSENVYGGWPNSGEIDIMESRGNDVILAGETNIGNQEVVQTLHFGKYHEYDGTAFYNVPGFHRDFHLYKVEWTPSYLRFQVDNYDPWYNYGPFQGNYTGSNSVLAPFDQEFHFIINLAVAGTNGFFPEEGIEYPKGKPYVNSEGRRVGQTKFWESNIWKYYEENPDDASLQVDYIKAWAV